MTISIHDAPGALSPAPQKAALSNREERGLSLYMLFWSCLFLAAVPIAARYSGEGFGFFSDWLILLRSPSKLITDYFELGGLAATLFNAALCGLACNLVCFLVRAKVSATLLAGYFLVVAHTFYGLNFLNMWSPFLGVAVYCLVTKTSYRESVPLSMFATSLGPFISDFLFRYGRTDDFSAGEGRVTVYGVLLSIGFGLLSGFVIPALLPGTTKMHRGFNLYTAGLAIGLFGILSYAFFYQTFGVDVPDVVRRVNDGYEANGRSYQFFMNAFFGTAFGSTFLVGFFGNRRSFSGYRALWNADGWKDDFTIQHGLPRTFLNIGIYGLCVLAYINLAILLTDGMEFTGPTAGVVIAAITFSASGQTPKNVWPIALGYLSLYGVGAAIFALTDTAMPWSLSTQGYINGLGFATGLCPFTGRYGRKIGVIAGIISAILCTSTAAMHGGFVLYNGGFTAGLTALLLLPILDFYKIEPKRNLR